MHTVKRTPLASDWNTMSWSSAPATAVQLLGSCPMGEDYTIGLVNHSRQVFDAAGNAHAGFYVVDGSIIPTAIGVNPFLTISALSERIAEGITTTLGGTPKVIGSL